MAGLYNARRKGEENGIGIKKIIAYAICFSILITLSALLQTTCLLFFGAVPMLTFAVSCAIGFLCGDKAGAVAGLFAGVITDALGGAGISFSPLLYMLCGYLCGALVGWLLSENLPSFLIYAAVAGLMREVYTVILYGLYSEDFHLWKIITQLLLPEFLAYFICVIPAYGAVLGIRSIVMKREKGKKRKL